MENEVVESAQEAQVAETEVAETEAPPDPLESKYLKQIELTKRLEREHRKSQAQNRDLASKLTKLEEQVGLLKSDPLKALEANGHSYEGLTERILKSQSLSPEDKAQLELRQKVEALEQEREEAKRARVSEEVKASRQQAMGQIQSYFDSAEDFSYCASLPHTGQELYNKLVEHLEANGENASEAEQGEYALTLEKATREAVHTQVETLIKKSPAFREHLIQLLNVEAPESDEEPDQQADKVEMRVSTKARPNTVTKSQKSAVSSRAPEGKRRTEKEREAALMARLAKAGV